jgi:four helix bundle protein
VSSSEDNRRLEERTLCFAAAIVNFSVTLKRNDAASVIARQLVRAGTSIGANYREANRAESRDDFVHKTAIALKEASETVYWLDLCERTDLGDKKTCCRICDKRPWSFWQSSRP